MDLLGDKIPKPKDKVLWIRYWAFGDVLQAAAEAQQFKAIFPDVHLTFLTKPLYADLIKEQPWCDDVIAGDKRPMSAFKEALSNIRGRNFDWVISLNHGGHTALMCCLSGIKNRVGTVSCFPFAYNESLEHFYSRIGISTTVRSQAVISVSSNTYSIAGNLLSALPKRKVAAIIGASCDDKRWPLEHWVVFLSKVLQENWGVVLVGSGSEEKCFSARLKKELDHPLVCDLTGELSIKELAGVISRCDIAVGNDTGPLHLAALSGVPTIGIADYDQFKKIGLDLPWFSGLSAASGLDFAKSGKRSKKLLSGISPEKVWSIFSRYKETEELSKN